MFKEELIARLKVLAQKTEDGLEEQDIDHPEADRLLLEFIGDEEVTRLFNTIEKWYA